MYSFNPLNKLKTNQSAQGIRPQLDLRFAEDLALDSRVDFSRGSNATVVDSDGTLKWAGHNLETRSDDFVNWTSTEGSVTANQIAAPDGTTTADLFVESTASLSVRSLNGSASHVANTKYFIVVYIKNYSSDRYVQLSGFGLTANGQAPVFDPVNGTVDTNLGSRCLSASITDVGNGWYKCVAEVISTSSSNFYINIGNSATNNYGQLYTGNGTSGVYLWGAHVYRADKEMQERTDVATGLETYYPTTASAYYAPRFDHDPATNESLGLLIEEARTNQILASEDFSAGSWGAFDLTVTTNQVASPDGTTNADKITEGTGSVDPRITDTISGGIGTNQTYATSCFLKDDDARYGYVSLRSKLGSVAYAVFDLEDGVVHSTGDYGDSSFTSASMEDYGNGWYRCILISVSDTADVSSSFVMIGMTDSSTDPQSGGYPLSITGDGSSLYVYGAQLEVGAFPTSYIPTSGSAVARSADVADVATSDFNFSATEGTVFVETNQLAQMSQYNYIWQLDDGTTDERIAVWFSNTSVLEYRVVTGASNVVLGTLATNVGTDYAKVCAAFALDNYSASYDGQAVVTDSSGNMPTGISDLRIGDRAGLDRALNGHIKQLTYFARRLDDATLQALTQPSLEPSLNLVFDSSETSYVNTGLTR